MELRLRLHCTRARYKKYLGSSTLKDLVRRGGRHVFADRLISVAGISGETGCLVLKATVEMSTALRCAFSGVTLVYHRRFKRQQQSCLTGVFVMESSRSLASLSVNNYYLP